MKVLSELLDALDVQVEEVQRSRDEKWTLKIELSISEDETFEIREVEFIEATKEVIFKID